jgi:hypothetical protein
MTSGRRLLKVLSKKACDSGRGIELRGTGEAVALPLVHLDLMKGRFAPAADAPSREHGDPPNYAVQHHPFAPGAEFGSLPGTGPSASDPTRS